MAEQITITPQQPKNKGLDYAWLKQTGISDIQRLSGDIWTDYNEHDPGVTTLEQLCYALTELAYRAELPLEDLLMQKNAEEIDHKRQALFRPESILPCNPVTPNDYRKLIVDRIKSVANVWLTPYPTMTSSNQEQSVKGLYLISVYAPDADECGCDGSDDPEKIKSEVRQLYNRHRDLCEDVEKVEVLTPVLTKVGALVNVTGSKSGNTIMANLLFNIGIFLAPELHRTSLQEKLVVGESTDSILEGPLLLRGLIDNEQMQPKAQCIPVNDIVRAMLQVGDVASVKKVEVWLKQSKQCFSGNDEIPVSISEILKLDTSLKHGQLELPIVLLRNGIEVPVNGVIVQRELNKIWQKYRRTYNLEIQYEKYFSLPSGHYRNLKQYYSIQHQYPDVYGINEYGVAENATTMRHAQAKQLKGFLLVFEQILANYFSQLEHVKDLYSIDPELQHSYFYQYLNTSVPNVEPLLKKGTGLEGYHTGLPLLMQSQDPFVARRNRFLSMMLAIYGQTLETIYVSPRFEGEYEVRLLNAKLMWLYHLVLGTCNRGRAMDYNASTKRNNIAGMQIKTRIQLGMDVFEQRPLNQICSELGVEIVDTNEMATFGRKIEAYSDEIEVDFGQLTGIVLSIDDLTDTNDNTNFISSPSALIGQKVTQEFLGIASSVKNFRIGNYHGQGNVAVLCKSPSPNSEWFFVRQYPDQELAQEAVCVLVNQAHQLNCFSEQLYLAEHILLRYALFQKDCLESLPETRDATNANKSPDNNILYNNMLDNDIFDNSKVTIQGSPEADDFVYDFTMTAVISASPSQLRDSTFRISVHKAVQQNAPANLLIKYCFINARKMCYFEKLYWSWRRALKKQDRAKLVKSSIELKLFLQKNTYFGTDNDFS